MHQTNVSEAVSPLSWAWRHCGVHKYADEMTRRYWRRAKRNGGKKAKTLRTHRSKKGGTS